MRVGYDDEEQEAHAAKSLSAEADAALSRLAERVEPKMRREFLGSVRAAVRSIDDAALEAAVREGAPDRVVDASGVDVMSAEMLRRLPPLIGRAFAAGVAVGLLHAEDAVAAKSVRRALEIDFNVREPDQIAWVRRRGADLVTEVSDSVKQAIRDILVAGHVVGRSPDEMAQQIRRVIGLHSRQAAAVENFQTRLRDRGVPDMEVARRAGLYAANLLRQRALLIARTETMLAASAGQAEVWRRAVQQGYLDPTTTVRVWLTARDERVCATVCEPLDGAEASMDGPFPGDVPYPPAHPACRCTVNLKIK